MARILAWRLCDLARELDSFMYSKIYWIENDHQGQIGTMGRPRGNDWLQDEVKGLQMRGVDILVSLLEAGEIYALGLEKEGLLCQEAGIEFIHLPIPDRNVPTDEIKAMIVIDQLVNALKAGKRMAVHCRIGVGRSSTIVASVLVKLGMEVDEVFERISKARTMKVPDTKAQVEWVRRFYK